MTKRYEAEVLAVGPVIEDEVLLLVKGFEIKCFTSYCPSKIEVGETYEVEFDLVLPDNDVVIEAAEEPNTTLIEMKDSEFSYVLYGYLDGSVFRSFVDFSDQEIHYEHPHLNGRFVKIQVDRIDVSF